MAYTTIDDPSEYFTTTLYTGTGSSNAVTNDANAGNFKPDWIWLKERSSTSSHHSFDSSRGAGATVYQDLTDAETTNSTRQSSFDTNGFTVGANNGTNESSQTYVAWQWKANGGTTSSNTDGTITSTVQANTTAGFSIVTFTGTSSNVTTGHGLNQAPELFFAKSRASGSTNWNTYTSVIDGSLDYLFLNSNDAAGNASNSLPTSSVIYTNQTDSSVAYCFHSVKGYSKIGKYTANGNVDGPFVYTGFKPAWVMFKQTNDSDTAHWFMYDSTRSPTNVIGDDGFAANLSTEEGLGSTWNPNTSDSVVDFVSNGFKIRTTATSGFNINGNTMIYMAFAEHPFVSSKGVPVTAR